MLNGCRYGIGSQQVSSARRHRLSGPTMSSLLPGSVLTAAVMPVPSQQPGPPAAQSFSHIPRRACRRPVWWKNSCHSTCPISCACGPPEQRGDDVFAYRGDEDQPDAGNHTRRQPAADDAQNLPAAVPEIQRPPRLAPGPVRVIALHRRQHHERQVCIDDADRASPLSVNSRCWPPSSLADPSTIRQQHDPGIDLHQENRSRTATSPPATDAIQRAGAR